MHTHTFNIAYKYVHTNMKEVIHETNDFNFYGPVIMFISKHTHICQRNKINSVRSELYSWDALVKMEKPSDRSQIWRNILL